MTRTTKKPTTAAPTSSTSGQSITYTSSCLYSIYIQIIPSSMTPSIFINYYTYILTESIVLLVHPVDYYYVLLSLLCLYINLYLMYVLYLYRIIDSVYRIWAIIHASAAENSKESILNFTIQQQREQNYLKTKYNKKLKANCIIYLPPKWRLQRNIYIYNDKFKQTRMRSKNC